MAILCVQRHCLSSAKFCWICEDTQYAEVHTSNWSSLNEGAARWFPEIFNQEGAHVTLWKECVAAEDALWMAYAVHVNCYCLHVHIVLLIRCTSSWLFMLAILYTAYYPLIHPILQWLMRMCMHILRSPQWPSGLSLAAIGYIDHFLQNPCACSPTSIY